MNERGQVGKPSFGIFLDDTFLRLLNSIDEDLMKDGAYIGFAYHGVQLFAMTNQEKKDIFIIFKSIDHLFGEVSNLSQDGD